MHIKIYRGAGRSAHPLKDHLQLPHLELVLAYDSNIFMVHSTNLLQEGNLMNCAVLIIFSFNVLNQIVETGVRGTTWTHTLVCQHSYCSS